MLLPYNDAMHFINGYKQILLEVFSTLDKPSHADKMQDLAAARDHFQADPTALKRAVAVLRSRGAQLDQEIIEAAQTLRVGRWIHLRHTTKYAILLDTKAEHAYAVKALTNPLHALAGGKSTTFVAGLVEYQNHYVCDGIIQTPYLIGANMRADFNDAFKRIKAAGRFHEKPSA
jgi:hypothetical protein